MISVATTKLDQCTWIETVYEVDEDTNGMHTCRYFCRLVYNTGGKATGVVARELIERVDP